jgi:hypothetical protein
MGLTAVPIHEFLTCILGPLETPFFNPPTADTKHTVPRSYGGETVGGAGDDQELSEGEIQEAGIAGDKKDGKTLPSGRRQGDISWPCEAKRVARTASVSVIEELKLAGGLKETGTKEPTARARTNSVLEELKAGGGFGAIGRASPSPSGCAGNGSAKMKQPSQAVGRRPSLPTNYSRTSAWVAGVAKSSRRFQGAVVAVAGGGV